jgi:integrase
MNPRTGCVFKRGDRWYALTSVTVGGKRKFIKRAADPNTKSAALKLAEKLATDAGVSSAGGRIPRTLHALLEYFEAKYAVPARYLDGHKIAGYRSHASVKKHLRTLRQVLPDKPLLAVSYEVVYDAKLALASLPVKLQERRPRKRKALADRTPRSRSLADVHRHLATLRRVLTLAVDNGWIARHPFRGGPALIHPSHEKKRVRVLSSAEESSLLSVCIAERAHLRPIIIAAIDTGMREAELIDLRVEDLDFESQEISVVSRLGAEDFKTKNEESRTVPMSDRLRIELLERKVDRLPRGTRVFGIANTFDTAFRTARRLASIRDLRIHDLRHTFATRQIAGGVEIGELARLLGHRDVRTTFRYVNLIRSTIEKSTAVVNRINESAVPVHDTN